VWESKTIWACVIALGAAIMSIVNHYVGDMALSGDALLSAYVAAVSAALGIVFRTMADHKLTVLPKKQEPPAPPIAAISPEEEPEEPPEDPPPKGGRR